MKLIGNNKDKKGGYPALTLFIPLKTTNFTNTTLDLTKYLRLFIYFSFYQIIQANSS